MATEMEVTASKDAPKGDTKETVKEKPKETTDTTYDDDYETYRKKKKREAKPPSSLESNCIVRMAQRISWLEVEQMVKDYEVPESEVDDIDSAISLLLALKHKRMIRYERFKKMLIKAGNVEAPYYIDIYQKYCNRKDVVEKCQYARRAAGQLIFFLKKELTLADICKLSTFISYKPDHCLDFIQVMQSLTNESKITSNKRQFLIMIRKIGRLELARRFEIMEWGFLNEMTDEWFKYGVYLVLDYLKARDRPDDWTMDEEEVKAKEGKLLEGEYSMEYNLN